jgi:diphthine-ammonia ligase
MELDKIKAFVSWSGGKDAALSFLRVKKDVQITHLLNMVGEDGQVSRSHGIRTDILRMQAEAMGLSIVQPRCSWETYEQVFKNAVSQLKEQGIMAGVFGDIDLEGHREWVERVSGESGIQALLPLWGETRETVMEEFINAGFEAVVVATRQDVLGPAWLGRTIDQRFIEDISKIEDVDISGEKGEYHTFVVSGPIFQKRINIKRAEQVVKDEHCFLHIMECELLEKDAGGLAGR